MKTVDVLPLGVRISNALVSYIIYIGKMLWPTNLAIFYPHPGMRPFWQVLGAVLILVAVTMMVIRAAKRFPYLAVGWLWFAGTLVPVIGIVQVGNQAMADRYTYIPLIGLFDYGGMGNSGTLEKMALPQRGAFCVVGIDPSMLFHCYMDPDRVLAK